MDEQFEINGTVLSECGVVVNMDDLVDEFTTWIESKGLYFCGVFNPINATENK